MELFDGLEKLLPIVVFVIWIFSAVLKQGKKKGLPSAGNGSQGQTAPPEKQRPSVFDELRKTLTSAIEEMSENSKPVAPPVMVPSSLPAGRIIEKSQSMEAVVTDGTIARPLVIQPIDKSGLKTISNPAKLQILTSLSADSNPSFRIDTERLREGIVWNEILSQPLSLRE